MVYRDIHGRIKKDLVMERDPANLEGKISRLTARVKELEEMAIVDCPVCGETVANHAGAKAWELLADAKKAGEAMRHEVEYHIGLTIPQKIRWDKKTEAWDEVVKRMEK